MSYENDKLKYLAAKGLRKRFKVISPSLAERLEYELNVIESIEASAYLLDLYDIKKRVDRLGVRHFCCGTANASLVCYCLGLTKIDPIEHDLLFESFIIPGQKNLPSFNVEFGSTDSFSPQKSILEKYRPSDLQDLIAIASLENQKLSDELQRYFVNKGYPEKVSYLHPSLQSVLKSTMGILMFQDQILRIAQIVGGFTLEEAENLRKALKNRDMEVSEKQASIFFANALRRKIVKQEAMEIFSKMKEAAPYVLYRAEAVAEAYLAFQGAYLRTRYPEEFS